MPTVQFGHATGGDALMTYSDHLKREYKRQFEHYLRFDKGCSRSIALRAVSEVAHGTIAYRLPMRRKIRAHFNAARRWWADDRH